MAELDENHILLIRTGGTIDAEPYADPKNPPKFIIPLPPAESLLMDTVTKLPNANRVDGLTWVDWQEKQFVKDSQKFEPEDVQALAEIIKADHRKYFVLTHGTDGMVANASALKEALKGTKKVVAFTGAMVPLAMDGKDDLAGNKITSDGKAMLQFTLQHIEEQKPGVYVVGRNAHTRQSQFFDPQTVQKNKEASKHDLTFTLG